MKTNIKYMNGVEWVELPYSDETLINELQKKVDAVGANTISMWFCETANNIGTIYVSIQNRQAENDITKIATHDTMYLHDIYLDKENWKDNLKEYQREKRVIKNYFPLIKVTSNFR